MDPTTLTQILVPVFGVTALVGIAGFCCIRSMIVRNVGDLRTQIALTEQRLQYQIQEMNTLVQPPPSCPSLPSYHSRPSSPMYTLPNQPYRL